MAHNLRLAWRMLAKRPGRAAGRVLTVTIVVAAVGAVFTVANATLFAPLPFPDAGPGRAEALRYECATNGPVVSVDPSS